MVRVSRGLLGTVCCSVLVLIGGCSAAEPSADPTSGTTASAPETTPGTTASSSFELITELPSETSATLEVLQVKGLRVEKVTDELEIPRQVESLPGGRLLISDQTGLVRVVDGATVRPEPFLDIREQVRTPSAADLELGLAGFALAPDFAESGDVYTFSTAPAGTSDPEEVVRVDTLTRWQADPTALTVDPGSAEVLFELPRTFTDHAGGDLTFDGNGLLYIGIGADTGSDAAQDPDTYDGTILRIDVTQPGTADRPYGIPPDNPFAKSGGKPEIFSLGYRNPFRLSWDESVGLLVSEPMFAEKDQQVGVPAAGSNAGYPTLLGYVRSCYTDGAVDPRCRETDDGTELTPPVLEYNPDVGDIVSGALIYRGKKFGELTGKAIVADWEGTLLAGQPGEAPWPLERIDLPPVGDGARLWAIDTDDAGNIYLMTTTGNTGSVLRLAVG